MNLLHQYKQWVRANSNLIGAIEGALSSLTWLLPDRFSDSELSLEALTALLGLLALYHESILQEPAVARDQKQPVPWPLWLGALQQVDTEWSSYCAVDGSSVQDAISHSNETRTSQVEVLVEMAARSQDKQGNLNLYTPLTAVEAVK